MKKEYSTCPKVLEQTEQYGFSWAEFASAIPSPLVLVTTYKDNGKTNATLQSWNTFVSEQGFFCIFGSVNKGQHMYETITKNKHLVINFPSADIYAKCVDTIKNNGYDNDEIEMSGLTAEKATFVNAPRIKECFLNLECEYVWEKEITPGDYHVVMCVKILNLCMDEEHYNVDKLGRYSDTGYLYNIHAPANPETGKVEDTYIGTIKKYASYNEL